MNLRSNDELRMVQRLLRDAVAAFTPLEASVVTLRGRLICADGNEADIVAGHLDRHVELTRAESGCLHFSVEPTADPLVWMVSERFVDKHAFDSHQARVRVSDWGRVTEGIMREYTIDYGADS